jgi:hypothetical protein
MAILLILLSMQELPSKFFNLAFGHLISLRSFFFKIGVLPFFEKHPLIME